MKNKLNVLLGIFTMSAMLASTGCVPNIASSLKDAVANTQAGTDDKSQSNDLLDVLSGDEILNLGGLEEDSTTEIAPADLAILDELPDILKNSDLPRMDHFSKDTDVAVDYYNPSLPGYTSIVCNDDGSVEIFYISDNNQMRLDFCRPSGTYLSFSVRGDTKDNVNAPVIGGYDISINGEDFAELSKDFFKNTNNYKNYYDEYDFTEDLETYQDNLYIIFSRFGILSNEMFDELGISWEDFGVEFGEEYKKYDAYKALAGTDEKVPMLMEKQTFTNGKCDATGKTWVETVHDGIKAQAIYNSREGEEPSGWYAYNEADSNNFVDGSDYVQIETYDDENTFMAFYHSGFYDTEDRYASKTVYMTFYDDETVSFRYVYETDFKATDTPGVISGGTRMGFSVHCKPDEIKDIFASEESLKSALEESQNTYYDESEYMSNDEMIADFMSKYKRYIGSIDDNIKTMGTCLGDYGIEY